MSVRLPDYQDRFSNIRLRRDGGVLVVTLHRDSDSFVWDSTSDDQISDCFEYISRDPDNEVIVVTGSGEVFCDSMDLESFSASSAGDWAEIVSSGQRIVQNVLAVNVPVIAAVNGPATIRADLLLLSDIIICSESATFSDQAHGPLGVVPGDGAHVIWTHVLGPQRGRYFLLTDQELTAQQALDSGVVNEVLAADLVLPRCLALAGALALKPRLYRRYSRMLLTRELRRLLHDQLALGLAHEALAAAVELDL